MDLHSSDVHCKKKRVLTAVQVSLCMELPYLVHVWPRDIELMLQ